MGARKDVAKYENEKEKFLTKFASLRPDLVEPEGLTSEKKAKFRELTHPTRVRSSIFAGIPLKCHTGCPFYNICPLVAEEVAPLDGSSCPIEASTVREFMQQYMMDLQVDPENLIEVAMIRDLVDQEIQYMRKTWLLSKEHFIQENVIGIDKEGNPVFTKQLHLAVDLEDRLHRRKKDLRNQLLASREARAKTGQAQLDTAQAISKLLAEAQKLEKAKGELLNKKLGRVPQDEYILSHEAIIDVEEE